jgi:hypothetical protein
VIASPAGIVNEIDILLFTASAIQENSSLAFDFQTQYEATAQLVSFVHITL